MPMDHSKLKERLSQYVDGLLTDAEEQEMFELIQTLPDTVTNQLLEEILIETVPQYDTARHDKILGRILNHESFTEDTGPEVIKHIQQHRKPPFFRWAAAASILIACSALLYWFLQKTVSVPAVVVQHVPAAIDIEAPKSSKAMITLPDGQSISLDSVSGLSQHNIHIHRMADGQVVYNDQKTAGTEVVYHTLHNPKGSKVVDLVLSDGTQVWLNCESSLRYPVSFTGGERKVEITGEAYFEVAKDAARPFKVLLPAAAGTQPHEVKVLGTHFNINSYPDEQDNKVTLLEGRIEVGRNGENFTLLPGQQASIITGKISIKNDVNLESVMAWKNGFFYFNSAGLEQIMRQVSRWYNIDVHYEGTITPRKFKGEIATSSNVSDICRMLEESDVHCRIENNKIIINP